MFNIYSIVKSLSTNHGINFGCVANCVYCANVYNVHCNLQHWCCCRSWQLLLKTSCFLLVLRLIIYYLSDKFLVSIHHENLYYCFTFDWAYWQTIKPFLFWQCLLHRPGFQHLIAAAPAVVFLCCSIYYLSGWHRCPNPNSNNKILEKRSMKRNSSLVLYLKSVSCGNRYPNPLHCRQAY